MSALNATTSALRTFFHAGHPTTALWGCRTSLSPSQTARPFSTLSYEKSREEAKAKGKTFTILTLGRTAFKRVMGLSEFVHSRLLKLDYLCYPSGANVMARGLWPQPSLVSDEGKSPPSPLCCSLLLSALSKLPTTDLLTLKPATFWTRHRKCFVPVVDNYLAIAEQSPMKLSFVRHRDPVQEKQGRG